MLHDWAYATDVAASTCAPVARTAGLLEGAVRVEASGVSYERGSAVGEIALLLTGARASAAWPLQAQHRLQRSFAAVVNETDVYAQLELTRGTALDETLRQRLSATTVAWSIASLSVGGSGGGDREVCPRLPGNGTCVAEDSAGLFKSQEVGCYREKGRRCSACDATKYWSQFGRLALGFEHVRQYEAHRGREYSWVLRVRSDFKTAPRVAPYAAWRGADSSLVYFNGLVGWSKDKHGDRRVFTDWAAVVPRRLAPQMLSVGYSYLRCQRRDANEPLCAGGFDWATPECVLKVHAARCVGLANLRTLPPWINPPKAAGGRLPSTPMPSSTEEMGAKSGEKAMRRLDEKAGGDSTPSVVLVSSMPLAKLVRPRPDGLVESSRRLGLPLWVLYDPDPSLAPLLVALPTQVRAQQIFEAIPELNRLMAPGTSPIEEAAALTSSWEPLGGSAKKIHGLVYLKLLVRKVATIHYALRTLHAAAEEAGGGGGGGGADSSPPRLSGSSPHRQLLLWADEDVQLVRAWDARLLRWAAQRDVSYVPLQAPTGNPRFNPKFNFSRQGMADPRWVVESGVMAFGVGRRTVTLAAAAMEMYEGGLLRIGSHCSAVKRKPCADAIDAGGGVANASECRCPPWVGLQLYPNDIYVWGLLLRAAHHRHPLAAQLCCLSGSASGDFFALRQGWLPWHTSRQLRPEATPLTAPFSLDEYAQHRLRGPLSERAWLPGKEAKLSSDRASHLTPGLTYASLNRSAYARRPKRLRGRWEPAVATCGCGLGT